MRLAKALLVILVMGAGQAHGSWHETSDAVYPSRGRNLAKQRPISLRHLSSAMAKKWDDLAARYPRMMPQVHVYARNHVAALEDEDMAELETTRSEGKSYAIVDAAAKRFAATQGVPKGLWSFLASDMAFMSLRNSLVYRVETLCAPTTKHLELTSFNEADLKQLLRNLLYVHEDFCAGTVPRRHFLERFLVEKSYDNTAEALLKGRVRDEVLVRVPLSLKLRATSLASKDLDLQGILTHLAPVEEPRALAILSFLRAYPECAIVFWTVSRGFSDNYIAWLAKRPVWGQDLPLLFARGELSKKQRRDLLAQVPYDARAKFLMLKIPSS